MVSVDMFVFFGFSVTLWIKKKNIWPSNLRVFPLLLFYQYYTLDISLVSLYDKQLMKMQGERLLFRFNDAFMYHHKCDEQA